MQRKLVAAAVSSALALPMAAQAVEFAVSGHVNRAVLSVDTGSDSDDDLQHVDANASQSRVRFTGSEELENGMTAGVNLEMGILSTGATSGTTTRHAALYLDTPGGKLTMGHTKPAADGMAFADLGGPSWLAGATNWCAFYSDAGNPACQSNNPSRTDVLRYDTPALGPVTLSVSAGDNDYWDAMLKVAGSFGDAGYDIRIGHVAEYKGTREETIPASFSPARTQHSFRRVASGTDLSAETLEPDAFGAGDETAAMLAWRERTENKGATIRQYADADAANNLANEGTLVTGDTIFLGGGTAHYRIEQPGYTIAPAAFTDATTRTIQTKPGDYTTASAAVAFGQGTSVAVAWSRDKEQIANTGDEYTYVKLDHSYGDGSVALYWKQGEKGNGTGVAKTEGSLWGVGRGHNVGAGATVYAGYRVSEVEKRADDVSIILAGMRVTFN